MTHDGLYEDKMCCKEISISFSDTKKEELNKTAISISKFIES